MNKLTKCTQVIKFKIVRRTSKYNKYIKWFVETYREDGSILSSSGYRTQKEARASIKPESVLPIGNRLMTTLYQEISC